MTNITPQHVNDMAKLIAAMNAGENPSAQTPARTSVGTPDKEAMSKILEGFRRATDDMVHVGEHNTELKAALLTETTAHGVTVGSWGIAIREVDGLGKFYDVNHALTNQPIASDLRLYEAAHALVKALNEGETITSSRVKTVLTLEEEYARNLSDAVGYAKRMKVTEGREYDIAEARYSEAKRKALSAKKSLTSFSKSGVL